MSTLTARDLDQWIETTTPPMPQDSTHLVRTLYSPNDQAHHALLAALNSAERSIRLAMYALDDFELLSAAVSNLTPGPQPKLYFQLLQITLDLSETRPAYNPAESKLLDPRVSILPSTPQLSTQVPSDPRFSLAIGAASSETAHLAPGQPVPANAPIMHLKHMVVDMELPSAFTMHGSMNWSHSGQAKQDNEVTFIFNKAHARRCGTHLDAVHALVKAQGAVISMPPAQSPVTQVIARSTNREMDIEPS